MKDQLIISWYRLIASDPGLTRLSLAVRAVGTALVALGLLEGLAAITGAPLPAVMLGVVIALLGSVMVNDPTRRQRQVTTLVLPLPAALAITAGAALASTRFAGDAVFVLISFGAVYARRFGPRGFALGMLAFITYFFALFLDATFAQLPWLLAAVVVGTACAFVIRFWVFPDRREARIRAQLRAFYARVDGVLGEIIGVIEERATPDSRRRRMLAHRVVALNETALMVEGELDAAMDMAAAGQADRLSPALALFDLELAVEQLAAASIKQQASADRAPMLSALRELRPVVVARHYASPRHNSTRETSTNHPCHNVFQEFMTALANAPDMTAIRHQLAQPPSPQEDAPTLEAEDSAQPDGSSTELLATTRQAIQVALAGGLAIIVGEMLSPQRWYWAAITAFVIFAGASSRGEILSKGWQRVAGTFAGVIVGIGVALLVGGQAIISMLLILACMFLAFYLIQMSYGLMMFWVTITLALLYGLMGFFSIQLLTLRLEETALGALIGVLVASFVLPTSTRSTVRSASQDYLDTLTELVDASTDRIANKHPETDVAQTARSLDRDFQQLRTAAKPLTRGIAGAFNRRSARRWLRAMLACRHYARQLARYAHQAQPIAPQSALAGAFTQTAARIIDRISYLRDSSGELDDDTACTGSPFEQCGEALAASDPRVREAARCLERIDRLMVNLLHDFKPAAADQGR